MSLAISSPALPLTMVQSGPYSETQATPRISLRSFVTWLCSSQMMTWSPFIKMMRRRLYCVESTLWIQMPLLKVGDWSAKIWSEDITESCLIWVFSHSTSFVYHPLKIFLVFSCPWLNLPSSSIWRWTLAWSSSLTAAGVQLGLHSSSPLGWMVKWTAITSLKLIYLLPRVYGGVGCDWNTTQPDYDGEGAGGASTLPLSSPWGLSTIFI